MEKQEITRRAYAANRRSAVQRARAQCRAGAYPKPIEDKWTEIGTAGEALNMARGYVEKHNPKSIYTSESVWQKIGGAGAAFRPNWSPSTLCRWIENPESVGLRLVGFADEINGAIINHTGWFTNEFQDESLRGVVFQIPGRNGRARFLSGYADPNNPPAALVDLDIQESDDCRGDESAAEEAKRDAARSADSLAESSAESERWYQESWQQGARARELAGEALATGHGATAAVRRACSVFRARRELPSLGIEPGAVRKLVRGYIAAARSGFENYESERDAARAEISEHGHGWNASDCGGFWEGYGEGELV